MNQNLKYISQILLQHNYEQMILPKFLEILGLKAYAKNSISIICNTDSLNNVELSVKINNKKNNTKAKSIIKDMFGNLDYSVDTTRSEEVTFFYFKF